MEGKPRHREPWLVQNLIALSLGFAIYPGFLAAMAIYMNYDP